ncbi:MAG: hypothetical protein ACOVNP_07725 [Flavobacterium sp.]
MENLKIFATSFVQIGLVAVNTLLIAKGYIIGIFLASFTISLLWSYNVSKIALSDTRKKLIYSTGAGCGAVVGYLILSQIIW